MQTYHKLINQQGYPTLKVEVIYPSTHYPNKHYGALSVEQCVNRYTGDWEDATAQEFFDQQNWYIFGCPEFKKWNDPKGKTDIGGGWEDYTYWWDGASEKGRQYWTYRDDEQSCDKFIELTFEQFKQMYDSLNLNKNKSDDTMDKPVKVTPATSKAIQLAGFANGWTWFSGATHVKELDESVIYLNPTEKYFSISFSGDERNNITLEEALELVSKEKRPLQFFGASVEDKGDSLKIKCTTFEREYLNRVREDLDKVQYHFGDVSVSKLSEELDTIL